MLKKIYQKNGIIFVFDDKTMTNKDTELCNFIINTYQKEKKKTIHDYQKEFLVKKGFIYPLPN